jgi:hypothetical protein
MSAWLVYARNDKEELFHISEVVRGRKDLL